MAIGSSAPKVRTLSERELTILQAIARSPNNSDVALELGISERAVAQSLAAICRKLGVVSRAGQLRLPSGRD